MISKKFIDFTGNFNINNMIYKNFVIYKLNNDKYHIIKQPLNCFFLNFCNLVCI